MFQRIRWFMNDAEGSQCHLGLTGHSSPLTATGEAIEIRGRNERPGILESEGVEGASLPFQTVT